MTILADDGTSRVTQTTSTGTTVEPSPGTVLRVLFENERQLVASARAARASNLAFLANPTPTQAEVLAQVRNLTRQTNALIRFLIQAFDATD